ncbi:helix-turn-helix domain-containing protein [Nocardioides koreensis]|uniref:TetR/AcrR family transcriptional regulator n=1 Tax=Nocardioides koreensis TaxID=433651 RepID=UPI0031E49486
MTPRAAAMAPDDRRRAILAVLVPLIVERGGDVSTREIARAAGIAEGTIFRVFPDKKSLMLAAAEEAINPADGQAAFDEAMAGAEGLRAKVVVATERVLDRMRLTMSVMMAARQHLMAAHEAGEHQRTGPDGKPAFGPPPFVMQAQEDLHRRLTGLFEPHRDELAVEPSVAAVALRSLIFGASRPELGMTPALTPDQIADLLLDGVRRRDS